MSWPANFDGPTTEGLILVPSPNALVQDLGPFLSGRMMITDVLPKSALVCASVDGKPVISENGQIRFAFEGNANQAANLERYYERCQCAAGRLASRSPSIAYGSAPSEDLKPVARIHLLSFVFTEILDQEALEEWSGEKIADFLPPSKIETPTQDPDILKQLCELPMKPLTEGARGVYAWSLLDGTILTMEAPDKKLTAWRPGDAGLRSILERSGLGLEDRMKMIP